MQMDNNIITVCYPCINALFMGRWTYDYELTSVYAKIVERTRHGNLVVILLGQRYKVPHKAIFCKRTGKCIDRVGNKNTPEQFKNMYIKDYNCYCNKEYFVLT